MPSYQVKQSSTAYPLVFLMVDNSDHITGKTGLSPTVTLSKAGGSLASPSGAVSEIGSGWYKVAGNATDSNTLGPLILHAEASGADPSDTLFEVVVQDPQATSYGLVLAKGTNLTGLNDIAATAIVSNGAITTSGGVISGVTSVGTVTTISSPQSFDLTGNITGNLSGSVGSVTGNVGGNVVGSVASVTAAVTVGTNNDKTGYSLTQSFPSNFASMAITAGGLVSVNTAQTLSAARSVSAVADTSLTLNDAFHCAIATAGGKQTVSGTSYIVQTPLTHTTIASMTLDSATAPTSRS